MDEKNRYGLCYYLDYTRYHRINIPEGVIKFKRCHRETITKVTAFYYANHLTSVFLPYNSGLKIGDEAYWHKYSSYTHDHDITLIFYNKAGVRCPVILKVDWGRAAEGQNFSNFLRSHTQYHFENVKKIKRKFRL